MKDYRDLAASAIWDAWHNEGMNRVPRSEYRTPLRQIVRDYRSGYDLVGCLRRLIDLRAPSRVKVRALRRMGGVIFRLGSITVQIGGDE